MITDQAAVKTAQRALAKAEDQLAGTTMKAPVAGTIGTVELTAGQQAGETSAITIIGSGAARIDASLPVASLDVVSVGQAVQVLSLGATTAVDGTVTSISPLPDSTSGAVTYPIQIAVADPGAALAQGAPVSARIEVGSATDGVLVPASAVSGVSNGSATVQVLGDDNRTATQVKVTVGAIANGMVQVGEGLTVGQKVVIADLDEALPTSTTQSLRRLTGGGGGPAAGQFSGGQGGQFSGGAAAR